MFKLGLDLRADIHAENENYYAAIPDEKIKYFPYEAEEDHHDSNPHHFRHGGHDSNHSSDLDPYHNHVDQHLQATDSDDYT